MKLLLDTHTLIWWASDGSQLSCQVHDAIAAPDAEVLVSAVSAYEMFYKRRIGKLGTVDALLADLPGYLGRQLFAQLPITCGMPNSRAR